MRIAVLEETNDVFVSASGRRDLQGRGQLGQRLGFAAISQFLASLRRFFRDLQTMAHTVGDAPARRIPRRFDPREALATPEYVEKALAGSEPRDIALAVWQRLAIQAARLTPEDLGRFRIGLSAPSRRWRSSGSAPLGGRTSCYVYVLIAFAPSGNPI